MNVPVRLVSITAFQPFSEKSLAGEKNWPPPLFTRKSNLPNFSRVALNRFLTCEKSHISIKTSVL
jgi:hypothetical protein